ncbi:3-keto-steroid reductase [Saccharomycopsis crataegensis]|uniref:3beta-hydroxysteroid 3-dehydrogenase n=1 Tax=Saccharomycopsis crataegensis TaxID=43959 RepID=A0AAV5QNP2_9ASCO|nr:3-keto-steroid reductase [Saccharomycopsis crataegensis]
MSSASSARKVAVITGTNSNLGINIAYRLLEEVPSDERLTIVVTSRSLPRANEVIAKIAEYNANVTKRESILDFDYLLIDFSNMVSVLNAYYELTKRYTEINYFYVNAAQGVYAGINWLQATKDVLINPLEAVTNPTYKIQRVGVKSKDGMGLVFQANVFGPYYLLHKIKPLLSNGKARVIWISSIMSDPKYLSFNDLQFLKSDSVYESSKRSIDLLHVATYENLRNQNITQYLVHPGIFTSFSFFEYLNVFSYYGMLFLFYFARLLGSPWHNIAGYKGANSVIFASLKANPEEGDTQKLKYGSATRMNGDEYIKATSISDPSGAADVLKYLNELTAEWDEKLKDQILETRKF